MSELLDNLSTHKTPAVHAWLLRHRRFHFHFTPWLAQRASSFYSDHTVAVGTVIGVFLVAKRPGIGSWPS